MLYIGCLGFIIGTAMSYVGTLPGAEHQLPLLRFGQPQVDGNVRDCQDLPGGPEQTWRQCVEQSDLLRFTQAFFWLVSILAVIIKVVAHRSAYHSHENGLVAALLAVFIAAYVPMGMYHAPLPLPA